MTEMLLMTAPAVSQSVTLSLFSKGPTGINVNYTTFSNNMPKTFANHIFVWESAGPVVPWQKIDSFVKDQPITQDSYKGLQEVKFAYEVGKSYIVGYAVTPDPSSTMATLFLPADNAPTDSTSVQLTMGSLITGGVQLKFSGLSQYNPSANDNWVAIWDGEAALYKGAPKCKAAITSPTSSGTVVVPCPLLIGSTYTAGYYMAPAKGDQATSLAAEVTFTT
ncbi:hypothetical protein [Puniceibacterium sediminis]|uniref:Uncharacterized protein n=1 Tax=Puniceibacterium sediminis TaxID=1608407 RepID=A0A238X8Y8_9RHOB|nr:hypothetical protein [Puniceibacterium sediminis]SNR54814.1 hypothetical protein SAMN06265370_109146 [Puniceibacterium sediminis]